MEVVKVRVLRKYQINNVVSPLNVGEVGGELAEHAERLASISDDQGGPAVEILQRNVPHTAGIGQDVDGGHANSIANLLRIDALERENADLRARLEA